MRVALRVFSALFLRASERTNVADRVAETAFIGVARPIRKLSDPATLDEDALVSHTRLVAAGPDWAARIGRDDGRLLQ
jgi:hypothetical protein